MSDSSLGHVPAKPKWEFDDAVTACFPDMLERSIPQYGAMRELVAAVALDHMASARGPVADLGASRGDALEPLLDFDPPTGEDFSRSFYALETSGPMLDVLRERYAARGNLHVVECDLRRPAEAFDLMRQHEKAFPAVGFSVFQAVLTLQFVPINYRLAIVREAYRRTAPGGCFVLVEKVMGDSAGIDDLMVRHYHELKRRNGYTSEEVERKRMALEGILVPLTAHWNEELLQRAGYQEVDCFWAWMNFRAWVGVRR